jgi:hypothetical protein
MISRPSPLDTRLASLGLVLGAGMIAWSYYQGKLGKGPTAAAAGGESLAPSGLPSVMSGPPSPTGPSGVPVLPGVLPQSSGAPPPAQQQGNGYAPTGGLPS